MTTHPLRKRPSVRLATAASALLAAILVQVLTMLPASAEPDPGGHVYRNDKHGFSLTIPAAVSTPQALANVQDGGISRSADGKARLVAVAGPNDSGETLATYRKFVMGQTYKDATFDYAPVRKSWFVLSGTQGDQMFYERITFVCGGRFIYGWQIVYPTAERNRYDRIVEAIHRSYRVGQRPDGGCR